MNDAIAAPPPIDPDDAEKFLTRPLLIIFLTIFIDLVGFGIVIPLLPFYVKSLGGSGVNVLGMHFGIGIISGFIVAAFTTKIVL